mmetsp:Transcript_50915/g.99830  ORF Transcript_50915/g.99830 Transcript_50915/m.99830 type:complete len:265 (+) Transcript_50915:1566-2360(+)
MSALTASNTLSCTLLMIFRKAGRSIAACPSSVSSFILSWSRLNLRVSRNTASSSDVITPSCLKSKVSNSLCSCSSSLTMEAHCPVTSINLQFWYSSTASASEDLEWKSGCMSGSIRLQAMPMFLAVSALSPVIIHTRIPAFRKSAIASGTRACSWSSRPMEPVYSRHDSFSQASNVSCTILVCSGLSSLLSTSSLYLAAFSCHHCAGCNACVHNRVRSPSLEQFFKSSSSCGSLATGVMSGSMTVSCPLAITTILPWYSSLLRA